MVLDGGQAPDHSHHEPVVRLYALAKSPTRGEDIRYEESAQIKPQRDHAHLIPLESQVVSELVCLTRTDRHDSRRYPSEQPLDGDVDRGLPPPEIPSEYVSVKRMNTDWDTCEPRREPTKGARLGGVGVDDVWPDPATEAPETPERSEIACQPNLAA
jgi:hypothetical protein